MADRLADAILVARSIYSADPSVFQRRLPPHSQLDPAMRLGSRAVAVFEADKPEGPCIQRIVGTMAAHMRGVSTYPISTVFVPAHLAEVVISEDGEPKAPDRVLRSILRRYQDRAEIRLLDSVNPCWRRFVICKELAHLIMSDDQGERASTIDEQLAMALAIGSKVAPEIELTSEQFAWFVAAEAMLPFCDRAELMQRRAAGEDHLSIARSYWIPKAIIDLFFETPYGELSNSI